VALIVTSAVAAPVAVAIAIRVKMTLKCTSHYSPIQSDVSDEGEIEEGRSSYNRELTLL
jgi:hypothetical protein